MAGSQAEKKLRQELIRDAIVGMAYRWANSEVFLYPLTDLLALYFQSSVVFTYWNEDKLIFSSLQDGYHFDRLQEQLLKTRAKAEVGLVQGYTIAIHDLERDQLVPNKRLKSELKSLVEKLKDSGSKGGVIFQTTVSEALKALSLRPGPTAMVEALRTPNSNAQKIEYSRILENLAPMRAVLDAALAEAADSPFLHQVAANAPNCVNVFAAFRSVPGPELRYFGSYNYTAALLLSGAQRKAIGEYLNDRCESGVNGSELLAAMELPLSPEARSIADALFSSGIVAFGRKAGEAGWDVAHDASDKRRAQAEGIVYSSFGQESALFYVPIHVGGVPWVAIFTRTDRDPDIDFSSWRHNYRFYRDIVVLISDRIRSGAKGAFADLMVKRFLAELTPGATKVAIAERVSAEWLGLAQTYPFPLVQLHDRAAAPPIRGGDETRIELSVQGTGKFFALIRPNPFFARQVGYGSASIHAVAGMLKDAVGTYNRAANVAMAGIIALSPHLLKVPIGTLRTLVEGYVKDTALRERMGSTLREISQLEAFGGALIRPDEGKRFFETEYEDIPREEFERRLADMVKRCQETQLDENFSRGTARILKDLQSAGRQEIDLLLPEQGGAKVRCYPAQLIAVVHELLTNALGKQPAESAAKFLRLELHVERNKSVFMVVTNATTESGSNLLDAIERLELGGAGQIGITVLRYACRVCHYPDPKWTGTSDSRQNLVHAKVQIGIIK